MFCPQCGTKADVQIKYCKQCGTQLNRVRGVMSRGAAGSVNWSEVVQEHLEEKRRQQRQSPEEKRLNEMKAGVITTLAGLSATIFLYFLLGAVAAGEDARDAVIISRVWLSGLVPTFVGLGILFNALFISPKIVALRQQQEWNDAQQWTARDALGGTPDALRTSDVVAPPTSALPAGAAVPASLPAAERDFSIIEHTTARLAEKAAIPLVRDTN